MAVLQSGRPVTNNSQNNSQSMEKVLVEVVTLKRSVGSSGGTDVNEYSEDKLRSLNEGEVQTVVEVSEESMAKIMGGPIVSDKVIDESIRVHDVGDYGGRHQE